MSVVALKKVTLYGLTIEKAPVLEELQNLGCLHLVSLKRPLSVADDEGSQGAESAHKALKWLRDSPRQQRALGSDPNFSVDGFVEDVLANQRRTRELSDQRDFITKRIEDLEPWGEFQLPGEGGLRGYLLWFYIVPIAELKQISACDLVWQTVHRDNRFAYVVVVAEQEPRPRAMPVHRTHTGAKSLSELHREKEELEVGLDELSSERERLTRWRGLLEHNMNRAEDAAALAAAGAATFDSKDGIFAIRAWAPAGEVGSLRTFASGRGLALTEEEVDADDVPPTLLHNPNKLAGGEDLVGFYQTPGYRTWDPSLVVFFSFTAFFAMILADAGYGILLGLLLARFWKPLGRSSTGSRMRVLFRWLVGGTIFYGVLVGSYFGVRPAPESLLGHLQVLDINNYEAMMALSILIGCAHIVLANALMAWHGQTLEERRKPLGWIGVIVGGLMLWHGLSDGAAEWWSTLGVALVVGNLAWVVWFNHPLPVGCFRDALMRTLKGLAALTGITRVFGDILSYMRLFALGLASASLAVTFNQLAIGVAESVPGLGLLIAILIVVIGHAINFLLAIMSGVVHGLRLNVLEFLRWSVSEEGYPFRAFAKKEIVR